MVDFMKEVISMKLTITLLVVLIVTAGFSVAYAQPGNNGRMLLDAVEKTDAVISKARDVVTESGSDRANQLLVVAQRLQRMAKELAYQAISGSNLAMGARAGRMTLNARLRAEQAIAITRQSEENEDYVKRRLDRTDDLIQRISQNLGSDIPPNIRTLLDAARERQQRAVELFRNRRLKMALQLTIQTEKSLDKLADNAGGYSIAKKRYQELSDRYQALTEQINGSDGQVPSDVQKQIAAADQFRDQAEAMAENGNFIQAEQTLAKGVELLSRLTETAREPAKVKSALESLKNRADGLNEKVTKSGNAAAKSQYRTALEHLEKASDLYRSGNFEAAAAQLQAARELLNQAASSLGD
jgi:hypothetical protein